MSKHQEELWNSVLTAFNSSRQAPPLQRVTRDGNLPLSFAQQQMWIIHQVESDKSIHNVSWTIHLTGILNLAALEQSLQEIVQRHEALRTNFVSLDGQPFQVISPKVTLQLPIIDLRTMSKAEQETEVDRLITEATKFPFDWEQEPLFSFKLLYLSEKEHLLLMTVHHIIFDGWSYGVFIRELAKLYKAFSQGKASPLPKLPIQYADYAHWHREWLQGERLESLLGYWKQQLDSSLNVLQLPTDRPRPLANSSRHSLQFLDLPYTLTKKLKALSEQEGTTLFITLLAAFKILLYRYTGNKDIIVGSPYAARPRTEIMGLIGYFVNTLPLRTTWSGDPSFRKFLAQVRQVALDAYRHQDMPFTELVKELQIDRTPTYNPVFQVMFVLGNFSFPTKRLSEISLTPSLFADSNIGIDLTLQLQTTPEGISGWFDYNIDLFEAATIARMAGHFQTLLESIVANPDQHLSDLPLLTPAEQHQLLVEWNNTQTDYPNNTCIHQLFEAQVKRTPDAIAVVFENQQLTYQQLNHRANQLAHYLQNLGVKPEVLVGICLERSPLMLVALLAILKAGGAYVPLDPDYPAERLAFMLQDTQAPVLLTQQQLVESLPACGTYLVSLDTGWEAIAGKSEENPEHEVTLDNLVYTIYTSGSTGKPKGITMSHRCLSNLILWQLQNSTVPNGAKTLQFTSLSFDVSCQEIFSTWCSGGTLVLLSEELRRDTVGLLDFLTNEGIERLFLPFVALQQLAEVADSQGLVPACLREIITAGEPLQITPQIANLFQQLKGCTLHNQYGPAESHVVTAFTLKGSPQDWSVLPPIGRPIANTQIYLLDSHQKPVPLGVPGELYIGGEGLARGYLNRPELTEEKFIPNPFDKSKVKSQKSKLYKTGDLARYLPDGNIEFFGRIDNQVKIRGFRIELGEIEAVLSQHPSVAQTVVIDREDTPGDKRLVAYVVPSDQSSIQNPKSKIQNQLRDFLKQKLPDYMIPSAFAQLDSLPLTPNGKIDRHALPAPQWAGAPLKSIFTPPRTLSEEMLAQIWAEVLGLKFRDWGKSQINIYDNFFELGGHSLVVARLISRVQEVFQIELPLYRLFEFPTLAGLAEAIETERQTHRLRLQSQLNPKSSLVAIQSGGSKRPFFLVPGGGGGENELIVYAKLVYLLGQERPVYGFQARGGDGTKNPHTTVEAMAADYIKEIRTVQPEGPYFLGGECIGGVVALEMAQQLVAQGQKVGLLVFLDTAIPTLPRELRYHFERFFQIPRISYHLRKLQSLSEGERLTYIFNQASKVKEKLAEDSLSRHLKKVAKNHRKIIMHYRPRTYPGQITWLVTESFSPKAQNQEWNHLAIGGLEIHQIPGTHNSYLGNNVETTAERLKACLDEAQADD